MTMQFQTIPPAPGGSPLSWWLLPDRAGHARWQLHRRVFRTRRELEALRAEVRQLEYHQHSLLRATELLLEASGISPDTLADNDGATPR